MDELSIVKTSDFTLATTLLCLGFDIIGMDRENIRRAIFFFKRSSELDTTIKSYFENKIQVSPLEFMRAQRELRAQIHTTYESIA